MLDTCSYPRTCWFIIVNFNINNLCFAVGVLLLCFCSHLHMCLFFFATHGDQHILWSGLHGLLGSCWILVIVRSLPALMQAIVRRPGLLSSTCQSATFVVSRRAFPVDICMQGISNTCARIDTEQCNKLSKHGHMFSSVALFSVHVHCDTSFCQHMLWFHEHLTCRHQTERSILSCSSRSKKLFGTELGVY